MMMPHLILRLDAPLMSFGGVTVDNYGRTDAFPATSLVTGLIANALGYDRTEGDRLDALQARIVHAARLDRAGWPLMDYQTVALSKDDEGWTTRGVPEGRGGGSAEGTHIRERDYWADRIMTLALRLVPASDDPDAPNLDHIAAALAEPVRPLFIGRKPCLPFSCLLIGKTDAPSTVAALETYPLAEGFDDTPLHVAWWPQIEAHPPQEGSRVIAVNGCRNWRSGVHGGEQVWIEGRVAAPQPKKPDGVQAA
jgi:CRISPR system Cascade subunit CasD